MWSITIDHTYLNVKIMKRTTLILTLLCFASRSYSQFSVSAGVKVGIARFTDMGTNQVGGFVVENDGYGSRLSYQLYGRFRLGKLFLQPELRYSSMKVLYLFQNVAIDDPAWKDYRSIRIVSFGDEMKRLDIPVKVGFFLTKHWSINAGLVTAFNHYETKGDIFSPGGNPFLIKKDITNSYRPRTLNGLLGFNYHAKRLVIGVDYDYPFKSLHNPVSFSGSTYGYIRKTSLYTFSIGYDIISK